VDLSVWPGEVLGLAGLLGSGRTELARLLFGLDRADAGEVALQGRPLKLDQPAAAIRHGMGLCPEDRKAEGIVPELSLRENIVLALALPLGVARPRTTASSGHAGPGAAAGIPAPTLDRRSVSSRRQPAEGAAGALAGHRTAGPDPRRAHARHRRGGAKRGDHERDPRVGWQRYGGAVHSSEIDEVVRISDRIA
jgi:simple sugar transport system ATP-binding protein